MLAACSTSPSGTSGGTTAADDGTTEAGSTDAHDTATMTDGADTVSGDTGSGTASPATEDGGTTVSETGSDETTAGETTSDESSSGTTGGEQSWTAVPGIHCAPGDRIGTVSLSGDGQTPYAYVNFDDAPPPQIGPPAFSSAVCDFHDAPPGWPCGCGGATVCDTTGECVARPEPVETFELVVSSGDDEASFDAITPGGQLPFEGPQFTFVVTVQGMTITAEDLSFPATPLSGVSATLSGTLDDPTAVDLSWDPAADDSVVLSVTNINHHVLAPVFTSCTVPASAGALHIDEPMLAPLAVSTGLEFQAIQHAHVAAAETDAGCVDFVLSRSNYAPLG